MLEAIDRWENEGGALPDDGRQPLQTTWRREMEAPILLGRSERRGAPPDRTTAIPGTIGEAN